MGCIGTGSQGQPLAQAPMFNLRATGNTEPREAVTDGLSKIYQKGGEREHNMPTTM